ncbi:unnamed protein product [Trichogramma brassicae]|uniref:Uncharacterized protein n=1 Tax=Trichogramma brassicae TaxID=86971 RepID=A0A6H5J948_9HYME|nr:unnamed protein product [Trichogramma brassicae]
MNYTDEFGLTHFHVACMTGCKDLVEKFLELGQVDPNCCGYATGDSPLHLALLHGRDEVTELLMRSGANPRSTNQNGLTPLHMACKRNLDDKLLEIFFRLSDELDYTLQVDAVDKLGCTPLHYAVEGRYKSVRALLTRGADPTLVNKEGLTPLHIICQRKHYDNLVKLFFEICDKKHHLVQVNARDKFDRTPLHYAVANLLPHAIDELFNRGADLSDFVFPTEAHFAEKLKLAKDEKFFNFKLRLASAALAVAERLEKNGYELDQSDAMTIVKLFTKYGLFEKSSNLEKSWYDGEKFKSQAKEIMIITDLSLYDLIQLRPEEAEKRLALTDYFKLAHSYGLLHKLPRKSIEASVLHLCEILSRRFFRRWSLYPLLELIHYRLPILCCHMIIDQLMSEDLYHICVAAASQSTA